ncbi:MAG: hypothetical protein JXR95_03050 [Deltaproteobacteria bacterium]|nr:hypothetical protein [Deltaproteobacteria bacterium]
MIQILLISLILGGTDPGIIKTSELKPGMKGYGLTVFSGTKPVKFDVEVISVMPKSMLNQDLILVRCSHPILKHAGVIAGMSGSPIYIKGKFAGGLGYGYGFSKDPIALLTPAEDIIKTIKRPLRNVDVWGMKTASRSDYFGKNKTLTARKFAKASANASNSVIPLQMAMSVSGINTSAFAKLFPGINSLGPVMPGATSPKNIKSPGYVPGGAVGIWLINGDINMQAIGTVTHIIGNRIAVFSHPFLTMGETRLPAGHAYIHTVIARQSSSMKLGSMLKTSGSLIKDEQATVVIDKSMDSGFVPMKVNVSSRGESFNYNFRLARNRFITPNFINGIVRVALRRSQQNMTDLTYTIDYQIKIKGLKTLKFTDYMSSSRGIALGYASWNGLANTMALRGEAAMSLLMGNPWKRLSIESVSVKAMVVTGLNNSTIRALKVSSPVVYTNRPFKVNVVMKPEVGSEYTRSFTMKLPENFKGSRIWLEVTSGRQTSVDEANPKNLTQLVDYITKTMDSHNLVLTIKTPDPSIGINGKMIRNIPLSVLDSLSPSTTNRKRLVRQVQLRKTLRLPEIVSGKSVIQLNVKTADNEAR